MTMPCHVTSTHIYAHAVTAHSNKNVNHLEMNWVIYIRVIAVRGSSWTLMTYLCLVPSPCPVAWARSLSLEVTSSPSCHTRPCMRCLHNKLLVERLMCECFFSADNRHRYRHLADYVVYHRQRRSCLLPPVGGVRLLTAISPIYDEWVVYTLSRDNRACIDAIYTHCCAIVMTCVLCYGY